MAKKAKVMVKAYPGSPLTFGKYHKTEKLQGESHADYEVRTWRERIHADSEGKIFIPPMMFKNAIQEAAKYSPTKIPGKGNATYTKHFKAGLMILRPSYITNGDGSNFMKDEVNGDWVLCSADGTPGGRKKVEKCFCEIYNWEAEVIVDIVDDTVTKEIFDKYMNDAGEFIGIGSFRPINGFHRGRFEVVDIEWIE